MQLKELNMTHNQMIVVIVLMISTSFKNSLYCIETRPATNMKNIVMFHINTIKRNLTHCSNSNFIPIMKKV